MSNDKIWAYSNTGNLAHAFVQVWADKDGNESSEHLRAMCRKTIARHASTRYEERKFMLLGLCANCVKLADAHQARIEDADRPATEAHDLGYVPTGDADSLDNEQRERLQAGFDAAVASRQASPAAETVTIQNQPVETLAETEIWARTRTGVTFHAFPSEDGPAMCRSTVHRGAGLERYTLATVTERVRSVFGKARGLEICPRCVTLAEAREFDAGETPAAETVTIQGQPVETLADAEAIVIRELRAEVQDAAHAEALEMDAAGEALTAAHADAMTLLEPETEPVRWHYRAERWTDQGTVQAVLEGYVIGSSDADEVERRIRAESVSHPGTRIANFTLRKA